MLAYLEIKTELLHKILHSEIVFFKCDVLQKVNIWSLGLTKLHSLWKYSEFGIDFGPGPCSINFTDL